MKRAPAIEIRNARTHNLKGVDCSIPHGQITVVTGLSGAGKSSLAFDTIFAEGQRRFVESMSTYARQFLDQMERPPVDEMENVLPAVALEARNSVRNARATVGTLSEVTDVLRLLFAHVGEVRCPDDGEVARRLAPEEMAQQLIAGEVGDTYLVIASVPRPEQRADEALRELTRQGFRRFLENGEVVQVTSRDRWPRRIDPLPLVLGRFRSGQGSSARVQAIIEEGLSLGAGRVEAHGPEGVRHFNSGLSCSHCGREFQVPVPALFSFNSPLGACPRCQGFGRVIGVDRRRVIPDGSLTLGQRPIAPWNTPAYSDLYDRLEEACEERGVDLDTPWDDLPGAVREWVWGGDGEFVSLEEFFRWLEKRSYKVHVRVLLARYRSYDQCPDCGGGRLRPEASSVRVLERTLPELSSLSVEEFRDWFSDAQWSDEERAKVGSLLEELEERVSVLDRVGLGYLTLDRQARTLSGGETQRVNLAAALGSGLTSTLYVLDEPTIGLHPSDSERLMALLRSLARRGNTVLVVEHDRALIEGSDHIIDLGPAAGDKGGQVLVEGSLSEVLKSEESLTASYLRAKPRTAARDHLARFRREQGRRSLREELEGREQFSVIGASAHNLRGLTVNFPQGALVAVTGVSGSGKSTLVENVLYGNLQQSRGVGGVDPGECVGLEGFQDLGGVLFVGQQPLGKSRRSNPVTYIKAYDQIRKLFAATPLARAQGITPGHFSFNVGKGRCPVCKGSGAVEVDMQFMSTASIVCDECSGRRFRPRVLGIRFCGLNIAETLDLTVSAAIRRFVGHKKLQRRLKYLVDAGLGYLRLGQSTATLSGGECQRLKLASFLSDRLPAPHLLLFDEPTTGLHMADIELLCGTLRRLVKAGHSVVVVEHSPDLIARADWVVDLGPGGGARGGDLLYSGPLESFVEAADGPTARELRRHLGLDSISPLPKSCSGNGSTAS
jgi:excinuclease ABC subunit A